MGGPRPGGAFMFRSDGPEGVSAVRLQLDDMPHGLGARGGWIPAYDEFLTEIFQNN